MTLKQRASAAALVCVFAAVVAAAPASASPCTSSTPSSQSFGDSPSDADSGLAPEITSTNVALDGGCSLTISFSIAGQDNLIEGETLSWYLNTDNNEGTGQPTFNGADYVVMILGRQGADDPPTLIRWDSARNDFDVAGGRPLPNAGPFGFVVRISDLDGLASGSPMTLVGNSGYRGSSGNSYRDWAPDVTTEGQRPPYSFTPTFSAEQAPPPPPPEPGSPSAASCRVPLVKGLTARRAKRRLLAAGCAVGRTRYVRSRTLAGRVVRTRPPRGTTLAAGARVSLVVGRRPRARASASRVAWSARAALARDLGAARSAR